MGYVRINIFRAQPRGGCDRGANERRGRTSLVKSCCLLLRPSRTTTGLGCPSSTAVSLVGVKLNRARTRRAAQKTRRRRPDANPTNANWDDRALAAEKRLQRKRCVDHVHASLDRRVRDRRRRGPSPRAAPGQASVGGPTAAQHWAQLRSGCGGSDWVTQDAPLLSPSLRTPP